MKAIRIRNTIKEYCRSRKITLRELSELSGIGLDTLIRRDNPTVKTLAKIMVALDCKFEDLIQIETDEL